MSSANSQQSEPAKSPQAKERDTDSFECLHVGPEDEVANQSDAFHRSLLATPDVRVKQAKDAGLFLELCAGSAALSACFREQGWEVLPIDHSKNRFHPLARVCNLDLALDSTWEYLFYVLDIFPVAFIHAAPPCGTCSRARQIRNHPSDPPVLRTEAHPMGLPQLTGVNLEKVRLANTLYDKLVRFLVVATKRKILWSVENPKNSLLWEIPFFAELYVDAEFVYFDACCYGGERLTAKAILTTCRALFSLAQKCQGRHPRKPFGKIALPNGRNYWAAKDEAQYPRPLCMQIVSLVSQALGVLWDPACAASKPAATAALANRQTRGRKCPPLVPEFRELVRIRSTSVPVVDSKRRLTAAFQQVPPGSKNSSLPLG